MSLAPTQIYISVFVGEVIGVAISVMLYVLPLSNRKLSAFIAIGILSGAAVLTHYIANVLSKLGSDENKETHHHYYGNFQPQDSSGTGEFNNPDDE